MARNPNLKKAYTQIEYTSEQVSEAMKCAEDATYFCNKYIQIVHPTDGEIPFKLYDYQQDIMKKYVENKYNILLSARQTGKTETTCAYILWYVTFQEQKRVLVVSKDSKGAMDIIERIQEMYENLPDWLKPGIDPNNWNKHTCGFDNGCKIMAESTTEKSGRGKSISLLYCDEFAFVAPHIQEKFWSSVLPTLSTGGDCIISSTPNGDSDKYAELWRSANSGVVIKGKKGKTISFVPTYISWDLPPGRDEDFKQQQIALLGSIRQWEQEYECQFLGGEGTLVDNKIMIRREEAIKESGSNVLFKIKNIPFYRQIKSGSTYILGLDPSTGSGKDFTVMQLCEFPSLKQVMEFRSNNSRSSEIYALLKKLLVFLTKNDCEVLFSVENNGVGEGIIALYDVDKEFPRGAEMIHEDGKNRFGFTTTESSKLKYANFLKNLIETNNLELNSLTLIHEIKNYSRKGKSYAAKPGSTDDCISAYLVVLMVMDALASSNDQAYDKLYGFSIGEDDYFSDDDITVESSLDDSHEPMPIII